MISSAYFITTSIGISLYQADRQDAEILIKNADIAMYKARARGGNQYAICTTVMKNKVIETMKWDRHIYRLMD